MYMKRTRNEVKGSDLFSQYFTNRFMYHWRTIYFLFCLSRIQERPRKRARTNGSNLNGASGERSSNGNKSNGSKADNERQGSSTSSGNGSSKTGGKGAGGGAIIESMHHHGKGVYSGTFSGMYFIWITRKIITYINRM